MGAAVDTFETFRGSFRGGSLKGRKQEKSNLVGTLVETLVGALVGALVGQSPLLPALCVARFWTAPHFLRGSPLKV